MRGLINSIRQKLRHHLKRIGAKYDYSEVLSKAYIGEGFYVNNRNNVVKIQKIWGSDKHWAYGGVLRNNILPLSSELVEDETELGIYLISYKSIVKARYDDFHYTLYRKIGGELERKVIEIGNDRVYRFMTHLDYEIFSDLYVVKDLKVEKKLYFKKCGKLEMEQLIDDAYIDKKSGTVPKIIFESCYYGLNAKRLWEYDSPIEYNRYIDSVAKTGYEYCRSKYVAIAIWQTAYLRYEEWQLFKMYKDKVVYMNTDSIYTTEPIDIEDSPDIGHYCLEYDGQYIQFIRRSAYAILNNKKQLVESKISGVLNEYITKKDLNKLAKGQIIKAKSRNEYGQIVEVSVEPTFVRYYNGEDCNLKYCL